MFEFNAMDYGNTVAPLMVPPATNELGPGKPDVAAEPALRAMSIKTLFDGRRMADEQMGKACLAGLWLLHNFLDESHTISQEIGSQTGSFWHGIMHRREPDPSNAKYWFRKVGEHPIFAPLQESAAQLAGEKRQEPDWDDAASFLVTQAEWDPFAWIDLCEQARVGQNGCKALCLEVQQLEWQLLFEFCFRQATSD